MTREEISKWLINLKNDIGEMQYQPLWHYAEALDMAIEALEELTSAEPIKLHVDHDLTEEEIENLKQKIADAPIVFMPSVERKRGEWAEEGYCPFCKCDMPAFIEDWDWKRCRTPYCPNCGASMEGEEDEIQRTK